MTREDAKHIVDIAFDVPQAVRRAGEDRTYHEDEIREAKNMAIKALEQEPIIDKIRAEIQSLRNCSCSCSDGIIDDIEDIIDKYKAEVEPQESEET